MGSTASGTGAGAATGGALAVVAGATVCGAIGCVAAAGVTGGGAAASCADVRLVNDIPAIPNAIALAQARCIAPPDTAASFATKPVELASLLDYGPDLLMVTLASTARPVP